jgi:transcriptional regulator with XRE-family HTH domain
MAHTTLSSWLANALKERHLSMRQLAREAHISHTTVAQVISGERTPTWEFCFSVSRILGADPVSLFRMAGLLPSEPAKVMEEEEVGAILRSLSPGARSVILHMLRGLLPGEHAPDQAGDLERDIEMFVKQFPELGEILKEAKRRGLSEAAIRALMANVVAFADELQRAAFGEVHRRLSDMFSGMA